MCPKMNVWMLLFIMVSALTATPTVATCSSQTCHLNWEKQIYKLNIQSSRLKISQPVGGRPGGNREAWSRSWPRVYWKKKKLGQEAATTSTCRVAKNSICLASNSHTTLLSWNVTCGIDVVVCVVFWQVETWPSYTDAEKQLVRRWEG